MPYRRIPENIGHQTIALFEGLGKITTLAGVAVGDIFKGKANIKLTLEQMVKIGVDSIPLTVVTSLCIGMVFALQISGEFVKFGAGKFVGGVMAIAISRELGPTVIGIVISARVAAAIAAEIGTMKVKEQIDALRALGASPIRYLVIPRFIAAATMLPLLTILANILGFGGGFIVASVFGKINPYDYLSNAQRLLSMWDVYGGLLKTIVFGMVISIIACYKGLHAKGGAKGVGEATTSSVVSSLISLFILNYFLSILFFK
jgi:phospholipid/cholesterol/gamma-HCH transport system permease protein